MFDIEVLKRYVEIANMTDLREMATKFALAHDYECLEIVIDEIEKRNRVDRKITTEELKSARGKVAVE
jgi:hypothetical protein